MYSDDSEHSESEFYYRKEADILTASALETESVAANSWHNSYSPMYDWEWHTTLHRRQRPENTKKNTDYDLNVRTRYFEFYIEFRAIENIPAKT